MEETTTPNDSDGASDGTYSVTVFIPQDTHKETSTAVSSIQAINAREHFLQGNVEYSNAELMQINGQAYHCSPTMHSSECVSLQNNTIQDSDCVRTLVPLENDCLEVEVISMDAKQENFNFIKSDSDQDSPSQLQSMLLNDIPQQVNPTGSCVKPTGVTKGVNKLNQDGPQRPVLFQVVKENGFVCNMALHPVCEDTKSTNTNDTSVELLEKDLSVVERKVTSKGSVFLCSFCKASFSRLSNLRRHQLVHTINANGERRYPCTYCSKKFHQKCDLKRHLTTHSGTEPFRCDLCDKGFIRKSDLHVHMRFHTRERAFKCEHCEKSFYQSGDLNRHIRRIHLKSQMFACGHCHKKFQQEATLSRHIQTAHGQMMVATASLIDGIEGQQDT